MGEIESQKIFFKKLRGLPPERDPAGRPTTIEERKEREEREELRESIERRSNMPVIPDEATYNVDGEIYHYVNGVLQYTPEETRQLLKTAHEQFAPIKKKLMEEAKHHDQM